MRKFNLWMLSAILTLCGLSTALTSCKDSDDGPQGTPISAEQLNKMWYAEATANYTFADGRQEQLKQVTALDFSADGTGREYSFYVGADNELRDDADNLLGAEFTYTNNDGVVRTTRKDVLNDEIVDVTREFRYQDGKLTMSNAGLSLSPATDAQKAQLEAWLPDGANSYNPNHTFNSAFWRSKQHIYLFTGKDYDVADAVYRGYVKVPLPWNESGRQVNLPMNFCDDITPENGWELVMNRCGLNDTPNENFFALYNKYLGTLRIFYYMPSYSGPANDHHWCVCLSGDMVYRSPLIYTMPQDMHIAKPETFGLKGVSHKDEIFMYITPWTQTDISAGSIVPRQGWWAFDVDLSTYRPDLDLTDCWIEMRADAFTTAGVTLFTTLQGSIDGSLKGNIDLKAQFKEGNKAAKVCGTVFKALKGATHIGSSVANFYKGQAGDGIAQISYALGDIGDICSAYGQDQLTGLNGSMNATVNLAMTAEAGTSGKITGAASVADVVSSEINFGENFKMKKTGLGQGVWSLKSSPRIYMTDVLVNSGFMGGAGWLFDPSSVDVELNPEVFGDNVEWMRVDAVCLARTGTSVKTIDKYRSALGLKDRTTYVSNFENSKYKKQFSDTNKAFLCFYNREASDKRLPEGIEALVFITEDNEFFHGAGHSDNSKDLNGKGFVIEPHIFDITYNTSLKFGTAPAVVVDVVVTVKLKDSGKTFVYSGEFLPEIEFLPYEESAEKWLDMYYRVKNHGPSYYQKYPDHNPTYEFHIKHMRDKMSTIYPNAFIDFPFPF